jgi:hypothetical protein
MLSFPFFVLNPDKRLTLVNIREKFRHDFAEILTGSWPDIVGWLLLPQIESFWLPLHPVVRVYFLFEPAVHIVSIFFRYKQFAELRLPVINDMHM